MIAGSDLAVAPQNLSEFFAIVTDARRVARPVAPLTAIQAIRNLLAMPGLVLLTVPVDVVRRWMQLLEAAPRIGQHAFDLFLVATMLGNGVRRIYTFNANHFQGIVDLEVQVPGSGIFNT